MIKYIFIFNSHNFTYNNHENGINLKKKPNKHTHTKINYNHSNLSMCQKIKYCLFYLIHTFKKNIARHKSLKKKNQKWNDRLNYLRKNLISSIKFDRKCVSVDLPSIEMPF